MWPRCLCDYPRAMVKLKPRPPPLREIRVTRPLSPHLKLQLTVWLVPAIRSAQFSLVRATTTRMCFNKWHVGRCGDYLASAAMPSPLATALSVNRYCVICQVPTRMSELALRSWWINATVSQGRPAVWSVSCMSADRRVHCRSDNSPTLTHIGKVIISNAGSAINEIRVKCYFNIIILIVIIVTSYHILT